MKQVILNADDLAWHPLINAAIERAHQRGALRSTSLMAGGEAFEDAVALAKRNPRLGVGLHLTLVAGRPTLPPEEIPSLVGEDGLFLPTHGAFLARYLTGRINLEDVRAELNMQAARAMGAGLKLTHVDSHQHLHVLPGILGIAIEVAERLGVPAMRIPDTEIFPDGDNSLAPAVSRLGLKTLALRARKEIAAHGLKAPAHFRGLVAGGAMNIEELAKMIEALPEGTTEFMLHMGTKNAPLQSALHWQHDFEGELSAITDAALLSELKYKQVKSISYKDF